MTEPKPSQTEHALFDIIRCPVGDMILRVGVNNDIGTVRVHKACMAVASEFFRDPLNLSKDAPPTTDTNGSLTLEGDDREAFIIICQAIHLQPIDLRMVRKKLGKAAVVCSKYLCTDMVLQNILVPLKDLSIWEPEMSFEDQKELLSNIVCAAHLAGDHELLRKSSKKLISEYSGTLSGHPPYLEDPLFRCEPTLYQYMPANTERHLEQLRKLETAGMYEAAANGMLSTTKSNLTYNDDMLDQVDGHLVAQGLMPCDHALQLVNQRALELFNGRKIDEYGYYRSSASSLEDVWNELFTDKLSLGECHEDSKCSQHQQQPMRCKAWLSHVATTAKASIDRRLERAKGLCLKCYRESKDFGLKCEHS
ncbi:uncharacterized protein AB675_2958 [Cyphellophora attinorum]|uniref:BTB domain-containing protein n=1 Tax=Cyphellophora attinorum TaxID=1664694 RepID=A0A0N1GZG1_9EURO|nr:uncharacterized protein AB675_2958 [Phialophora attinorum]KPI36442.1 hypothetical protein AB675_2958 [Phialophora attinorum]